MPEGISWAQDSEDGEIRPVKAMTQTEIEYPRPRGGRAPPPPPPKTPPNPPRGGGPLLNCRNLQGLVGGYNIKRSIEPGHREHGTFLSQLNFLKVEAVHVMYVYSGPYDLRLFHLTIPSILTPAISNTTLIISI